MGLDDRLKDYSEKETSDLPSMENRVLASLSYVSILFVVPWLLRGHESFINQHIRQGIVLFLLEVIAWVLFRWLIYIGFIWKVLVLAFVALAAFGIYKAMTGDTWEIPFVGKYGRELTV